MQVAAMTDPHDPPRRVDHSDRRRIAQPNDAAQGCERIGQQRRHLPKADKVAAAAVDGGPAHDTRQHGIAAIVQRSQHGALGHARRCGRTEGIARIHNFIIT
jgi:hypothetical protein